MFTNTKHTKKAYIIFLFVISLISIILQYHKAFIKNDTSSRLIVNQFYFTTQSNYLVLITSGLLLFKKEITSLKHITFYSITITGLIFHAFLASHVELDLVYHSLHSVTPLLYLVYYLFFNKAILKLKDILILFIHPIVFIFLTYFVLNKHFMDDLIAVRKSEFIYPFLNPNYYNNNYLLMIIALTFSYIIIVILLNRISNFLIKKIHKFE